MSAFSHFDEAGHAIMVDVTDKAVTERTAIASGRVLMRPETLAAVEAGGIEKGDVLGVARLAGIMAAKRTFELIPLCHPLPLSSVTVELGPHRQPPAVARRHWRSPPAVTDRCPTALQPPRPRARLERHRLPAPSRRGWPARSCPGPAPAG